MRPQFSAAYLDALFTPGKYENLCEIVALIEGSETFDREVDNYGLGSHLFILVESLVWFAQSVRSGAWTYFEVTPRARQLRMLAALDTLAPEGFAEHYKTGMEMWQDEFAMLQLDRWMEEHDDENNQWLWRLAHEQRSAVLKTVV
jgi:hypothetical protein